MNFWSQFQPLCALVIPTVLLCPTNNDGSAVRPTGPSVHVSVSLEGTDNEQYKPIYTRDEVPIKPVPALDRRLCHKLTFERTDTHTHCVTYCARSITSRFIAIKAASFEVAAVHSIAQCILSMINIPL
jgi:hypothetical protein